MESDGERRHEPVLLAEAMEWLAVRPGGSWVDATLGPGGHARAILERTGPAGRLLATDRDAESLAIATRRLAAAAARLELVHADFRELPDLLDARGLRPDGVLVDLGVSSLQLDDPERGFSFRADGPLDMRMDRSTGVTAADLVNDCDEQELADLIYRYGEERASRRIARAIVAARRRAPLRTTAELATLVRRAARRGRSRLDPATRTFQALRIAVNRELEDLGDALCELAARLAVGGRLVVIAFHSLEDREVKHGFRELGRHGFRVLTRRPVRAGEAERGRNPRSRSARLRALERTAEAA